MSEKWSPTDRKNELDRGPRFASADQLGCSRELNPFRVRISSWIVTQGSPTKRRATLGCVVKRFQRSSSESVERIPFRIDIVQIPMPRGRQRILVWKFVESWEHRGIYRAGSTPYRLRRAATTWRRRRSPGAPGRVPTQSECEKIEPGGQCVRKPVLGFSHTLQVQSDVTHFAVWHWGTHRRNGGRSY